MAETEKKPTAGEEKAATELDTLDSLTKDGIYTSETVDKFFSDLKTSALATPAYKKVYLKKGPSLTKWQTIAAANSLPVAAGLDLFLEKAFSSRVSNNTTEALKAFKDKIKEFTGAISKGLGGAVGGAIDKVSALGSTITTGGNLLKAFSDKTAGETAILGIQKNVFMSLKAWESTDPLELSLTFNFYMGMTEAYDGKTEVFNPIMALTKMFSPEVDFKEGKITPPGIGIYQAMSIMFGNFFKTVGDSTETKALASSETDLKASDTTVLLVEAVKKGEIIKTPDGKDFTLDNIKDYSFAQQREAYAGSSSGSSLGDSVSKVLTGLGTTLESFGANAETYKDFKKAGNYITLEIGGEGSRALVSISDLTVKEVSYSFANEFDDKGYPVSGDITLKFESALMAHADTITTRK